MSAIPPKVYVGRTFKPEPQALHNLPIPGLPAWHPLERESLAFQQHFAHYPQFFWCSIADLSAMCLLTWEPHRHWRQPERE